MRDIKQLHPELQRKIEKLRYLCDREDLPLGIGECLRTVKEQDDLCHSTLAECKIKKIILDGKFELNEPILTIKELVKLVFKK